MTTLRNDLAAIGRLRKANSNIDAVLGAAGREGLSGERLAKIANYIEDMIAVLDELGVYAGDN